MFETSLERRATSLADHLFRTSGVSVQRCYQCGKCSAGCPMAAETELRPHDVLRLISLNRRAKLLSSESLWLCVGCETCTARCPNEVDPARLIDGLRAQGYSFATLEDYALWRWGRPSAEVTPGPDLFDSCVPQSDWGCESLGVAVGTDPARDVCGRMWRAYQSAGGFATLGAPRSACVQSSTGSETQSFERATLELHPENPIPCNVVAIPAPNAP